MKPCIYKIQLPNGGEIIIPASFGNIAVDDFQVNNLINNLNKFSESEKNDYLDDKEKDSPVKVAVEDLVNLLNYRKTPDLVKKSTIERVVTENLLAPEKIVDNINKEIEKSGNITNLESAIRVFARQNPEVIQNYINKMNKPVSPTYFKGLNTLNIIGKTNIKSELNNINSEIGNEIENGFDNSISVNLRDFLKGIKSIIGEDSESLLPINTKINQNNTLNLDNFTFYQQGNKLSLFVGIFKRIASKLNPDELKKVLEDANKLNISFKFNLENFDPNKFFNGNFDNKNFVEGEFHKLFEYSSFKPVLNKIIDLVSNHIALSTGKTKENYLVDQMKYLFYHVDPKTYGKGFFSEQQFQEKFFDSEHRLEIELKNKISAEKVAKLKGEDINQHFAQSELISSDLYTTSKNLISPGYDLVKFPIPGFKAGMYAVVTALYPRKNGVEIMGVFIDPITGEVKKINKTFKEASEDKEADKIEYRKYEQPIQQYDPFASEDSNTVLIAGKNFDQNLIKRLVRIGSTIYTNSGSKLLVLGVNPGNLIVKQVTKNIEEKIFPFSKYNSIVSFTSNRAYQDLKDLETININEFRSIQDMSLLSEGDFFIDPDINIRKRVIYSDTNNVYTIVKSIDSENQVIKAIEKSRITKGFSHVYSELKGDEINKILNESSVSKSMRKMSSFENIDSAKKGDYLIYIDENGNKVVAKVVDPTVKKAVALVDRKIESINYTDKNPTFYTDRNISSTFSLAVIRANN